MSRRRIERVAEGSGQALLATHAIMVMVALFDKLLDDHLEYVTNLTWGKSGDSHHSKDTVGSTSSGLLPRIFVAI